LRGLLYVETNGKQYKIAISSLYPQLIFDLSDLFSIANGFYKIHKNPVNISLSSLDYVHLEHRSRFAYKKQGPCYRPFSIFVNWLVILSLCKFLFCNLTFSDFITMLF